LNNYEVAETQQSTTWWIIGQLVDEEILVSPFLVHGSCWPVKEINTFYKLFNSYKIKVLVIYKTQNNFLMH